MFLFDKIDEAEKMADSDEISIRVDHFLSLVDIWIMSNILTMHIHEQNEQLAAETMIKVSALVTDFDKLLKGEGDD